MFSRPCRPLPDELELGLELEVAQRAVTRHPHGVQRGLEGGRGHPLDVVIRASACNLWGG